MGTEAPSREQTSHSIETRGLLEIILNLGQVTPELGLFSKRPREGDSIWILTDSRSSIQYLKNWPKIMDSTGLDILSKLVRLGQRKQVCLQWIPSHVGVPGNKAADELAGRGCDLPNPSSTVLTHTEIYSFQRNKMNLTWRNPPAHHWYAAKSPGLSIQCRSSRAHQMAWAHHRSGHLRNRHQKEEPMDWEDVPFLSEVSTPFVPSRPPRKMRSLISVQVSEPPSFSTNRFPNMRALVPKVRTPQASKVL
ncbi:RNase H domain-containing protein [Trichonephila clavipes]|nr:RNase H domain-containing protein [Trichonephila clavipes]